MNKKKLKFKILFLTFLYSVIVLHSTVFGATLYVGPSETYTTIQAAVDAAGLGDTIIVRDGTYIENVTINTSLILQSENGYEFTAVNAANSGSHIFYVLVPNVTIQGFDIYGATTYYRAGIYFGTDADNGKAINNRCGYDTSHRNYIGISIYQSDNIEITNNICNEWGLYGILANTTNNSSITGNTALSHGFEGIYLVDSSNNTISNNILTGNRTGIELRNSVNNTVNNNTCDSNTENGIHLENSSSENSITNNTCSSNTEVGIYVEESDLTTIRENTTLENDMSGIVVFDSNNSKVIDNTSNSNDDYGISIIQSDNCSITKNITNSNDINGLRLYISKNNIISENEANYNNYVGINFYSNSTGNIVTKNVAHGNRYMSSGCGIAFNNSSGNTVYSNQFSNNNSANVCSSNNSINTWVSPETVTYTYNNATYTGYLGNYYSDHDLTDTDGNGITDNPYVLPNTEPVDAYPLADELNNFAIKSVFNLAPILLLLTN